MANQYFGASQLGEKHDYREKPTAVPIACRYCLRALLPTPGGIQRHGDPGVCQSCGRGVYNRYATQ